jgi:hypothetical protein
MLEWKGQPRTPKELAAQLIWAAIEDLAADWQPDWRERPGNPLTGAGPTASEIAAVRTQIGRYLERLRELLRVEVEVGRLTDAAVAAGLIGAVLPCDEEAADRGTPLDAEEIRMIEEHCAADRDLEARELQAELEEREL